MSLLMLDSRFLRQERSFRSLYDIIRVGQPSDIGSDRYFTMDASVAVNRADHILRVAASTSLALFYVPLLVLIGLSAVVTLF